MLGHRHPVYITRRTFILLICTY
eukprot:UN18737